MLSGPGFGCAYYDGRRRRTWWLAWVMATKSRKKILVREVTVSVTDHSHCGGQGQGHGSWSQLWSRFSRTCLLELTNFWCYSLKVQKRRQYASFDFTTAAKSLFDSKNGSKWTKYVCETGLHNIHIWIYIHIHTYKYEHQNSHPKYTHITNFPVLLFSSSPWFKPNIYVYMCVCDNFVYMFVCVYMWVCIDTHIACTVTPWQAAGVSWELCKFTYIQYTYTFAYMHINNT